MIATISQWQTLIGSVVAIGAAFVGGGYINRQIHQADRLEEERLRRRLLAARAVLPLALSTLSRYARDCAAELQRVLGTMRNDQLGRSEQVHFPAPPATAIASLTEIIEASGEDRISIPVSKLLSEIQVQSARLAGLEDRESRRIVPARELQDHLLGTARVEARISSMYEYARGECDDIPLHLQRGDVPRSLSILGVYGGEREEMEALALRSWDRAALRRLRSGEKDPACLAILVERNPDYVKEQLGIEDADEQFRFRGHLYDRLLDAASYALVVERRSAARP
jgi:hypothetical protein